MALLAEEIVEEWLNRDGYFTIRGIKLGVHEIDLLAVKLSSSGVTECRHIEVQASMRPIGYISNLPASEQKKGRAANSAKQRTSKELIAGVKEWIDKKFHHSEKQVIRQDLCSGDWSFEFVINNVRSEEEISLIESHRVKIIRLPEIIKSLSSKGRYSAAGADFIELIALAGTLSD